MALKFYTSVANGLKVKVTKLKRLIPPFSGLTEENLAGVFPNPPHLPFFLNFNRVTVKKKKENS